MYSDGVNIFDPRYLNQPVIKAEYFRMLRQLNPEGFHVFEKVIE